MTPFVTVCLPDSKTRAGYLFYGGGVAGVGQPTNLLLTPKVKNPPAQLLSRTHRSFATGTVNLLIPGLEYDTVEVSLLAVVEWKKSTG